MSSALPTSDRPAFRRGVVRPAECVRQGWAVVKDDYWRMLGVTLVGTLIAGVVPFGLLAGPMMCGVYLCLLRRARGRRVAFDMLFRGFDHFAQSLIATLLLVVPVFVMVVPAYIAFVIVLFSNLPAGPNPGPMPPDALLTILAAEGALFAFVMVISLVIGVFFMFTYPLIADRGLSGVGAVKLSIRAAVGNLGGVVGLVLLNAALSIVGLLACYVGAILVMPVSFAAIASAYLRVFPDGDDDDVEDPDGFEPDYADGGYASP